MPGNKTKRGETADSPSKILNRVRDLLIYTESVTRPTGDKTMTVSQALQAMRLIAGADEPERRRDMVRTFQSQTRCKKRHGFPKSATHTYIRWLQTSALTIFSQARQANDLFPSGSAERRASMRRERIRIIDAMLAELLTLLDLVRLSEKLSFISVRQMEHWTRLALDVQIPLRIWRKNERTRLDRDLAEISRGTQGASK